MKARAPSHSARGKGKILPSRLSLARRLHPNHIRPAAWNERGWAELRSRSFPDSVLSPGICSSTSILLLSLQNWDSLSSNNGVSAAFEVRSAGGGLGHAGPSESQARWPWDEMASVRAVNNAQNILPPSSPRAIPTSPTPIPSPSHVSAALFDQSLASVLAASTSVPRPQHHRRSSDDPPSAAHQRPKLRDRGKTAHAPARPPPLSPASSKALPALPDAPTTRPNTSPSASKPSSPLPLSPPAGSATPRDSLRRRASTTTEPLRSPPLQRRPPASHSCHGVETSSGPPPVLSLRPLANAPSPGSVELRRKATPPSRARETELPEEHEGLTHLTTSPRPTREPDKAPNAPLDRQDSGDSARPQSRGRRKQRTAKEDTLLVAAPLLRENHASAVIQTGTLTPKPMYVESEMAFDAKRLQEDRTGGSGTYDSRQSQSSGEDLFLNLAKTDGDMDDADDAGSARRRVSF